ncbi:interleukin 17-like protein [Mercenaria mercenaria]|uniref:interleukin 17-like protein n=1 Tax=Mercenaria mercenaria TaxID=6596 RepID=UPI001E1D9B4B|nr:interleukin 17-like protein [Mercenaria mercenaria]
MNNAILTLLAIGWLMQCLVQIATTQCIHSPDAEEQKLQLKEKAFRDYLLGHWTYTTIDEYRKNTRPRRLKNLIDLMPRQSRIYGEQSCRKNRNVAHDSDISSKSTCPWYIVMDVDFQREPQSIAKAKCSCKRCFTIDRSGRTRDRCAEVKSFIPVIKWRCPNNFSGTAPNYFEYFVDFETVPVGCTCKRPVEVTH